MNVYMTNTGDIPIGLNEDELIKKNATLTQEKEAIENELQQKEKEIKDLSRKIESIVNEYEHQKELTKNAENLLSFYKNQLTNSSSSTSSGNSPEKSEEKAIKDLEIKLLSSEEKIEEYEKQLITMKKELEEATEEKKELNDLNEKMINMLTEKEIETTELKEKIEELSTQAAKSNGQTNVETNDDNYNESSNGEEFKQLQELYRALEEEYNKFKLESEDHFTKLSEEYEQLKFSEHELQLRLIDYENDNMKLREELQCLEIDKMQLENEKKECWNPEKTKSDILLEVENLQNQIQELKESKEKLLINSDQEKNYVISERIEIENLYNQVKEEKNNLEKELISIKDYFTKELNTSKDKYKHEILVKTNEINKLQETIIEVEKNYEITKKENVSQCLKIEELQATILDKTENFANEKNGIQKQLQDLSAKCEIEKKILNSRIKDLSTKNEELQKEIKTLKNGGAGNDEFSLENILDGKKPTSNIANQKEIEEKDKQIQSLLQEKKYYERTIKEIKDKISLSSNAEQLKAENEYLNKNNEILNNQIKTLKEEKAKDELYYQTEIKNASDEAVNAKCQLAVITYEKDNEILKWKKYVKKFEMKLQQIGITISRKK